MGASKITGSVRRILQDVARGIERVADPELAAVMLIAMVVALLLGWDPTGAG